MSANRGMAEVFHLWQHWPEALEQILIEHTGWRERGSALARWLRNVLPGAPFAGCQFTVGGQQLLAVDPDGAPFHASLQTTLANAIEDLPEATSLAVAGTSGAVLSAGIHQGGTSWGRLILGLPAKASAEIDASSRFALRLVAAHLASRLALEAREAELAEVITVAEATGTLTHDLSNHLNSIMLQAAVLEMQAPNLAREASVVRTEGKKAAACLQPLQQFRQQRRSPGARADLTAVLKRLQLTQARRLVWDGAANEPVWIPTDERSLERILRILLRLFQGERPEPAPVLVQMTADEDAVTLLLDCTVPPPARGGNLAEELVRTDALLLVLERLALRSLLRSTRGTLTSRPEAPAGGVLLRWSRQT